MKPLLLHGLATNVSRKKLLEIKQKSQDVVVFDKNTSIQEIMGSLMTVPLLSEERLIILENPPEELTFDATLTSNLPPLIIWFDHELSEKKKIMQWAKENGQILFFPEGKEITVFPFLDMLASKDKKAFLQLERLKEKEGYDIFYFLTMTFYLLRNLAVTPKNAPSFIKQKIAKQRRKFSQDDVKDLYRNLLEIEFKLKNGSLEQFQAEFLLVNKFIAD